jgi:2-dehydro-3-deoxygalactonokinase
MTDLVALDWGTSSLRVARLDAQGQVLEERSSAQGILNVPPGGFPAVFERAVEGWDLPHGTLCLAGGMVGSRQGWREAPYCACPAGPGDLAGQLAWVPDAPLGVRLGIAPGLRTEALETPDVLRGEEVQVFGALDLLGMQDGLFVLPGTHSKWVRVQGGRIMDFATYMTGEVYAALRRHTILARTMPEDDGALDGPALLRGVLHALRSDSLLHSAFSARTLALFSRLAPESLPSYLSGLVIGEELRAQRLQNSQAELVLVGAPALTHRYQLALRTLGLRAATVAAQATWRGLWALALSLEGTT